MKCKNKACLVILSGGNVTWIEGQPCSHDNSRGQKDLSSSPHIPSVLKSGFHQRRKDPGWFDHAPREVNATDFSVVKIKRKFRQSTAISWSNMIKFPIKKFLMSLLLIWFKQLHHVDFSFKTLPSNLTILNYYLYKPLDFIRRQDSLHWAQVLA